MRLIVAFMLRRKWLGYKRKKPQFAPFGKLRLVYMLACIL